MDRIKIAAAVGLTLVGTAVISLKVCAAAAAAPAAREGEVAVTFSGGHDTLHADGGRPVVLVAAALGVPTEVFRDAFTHVHPAKGGGPTGDEARKNKYELLSRLEKYGVTNDRLDEVSNFYRYRPQSGELWKHRDAVAFASVKDGVVTGFRVADPGYGYSTPPTVSIDGRPDLHAVPRVRFDDKDLTKNGSIDAVVLTPPTTAP